MKTMKEIIGDLRSRLGTLPEVEDNLEEDRKAGKYKKGEIIVSGQWPNPDQWAKEYIMPNVDKKGVRIYSTGPSFKIEKL